MESICKFKVGDRVAVYDTLRITGTIRRITASGDQLEVELDSFATILAHPKQCRRLVKKKRREFWITIEARTGEICGPYITEPSRFQIDKGWEIVHVREVKP